MIPIEYAEEGKIRLPDIIVKMIRIRGNWLQIEKSGQASRILVDFLKGAVITQAQNKS